MCFSTDNYWFWGLPTVRGLGWLNTTFRNTSVTSSGGSVLQLTFVYDWPVKMEPTNSSETSSSANLSHRSWVNPKTKIYSTHWRHGYFSINADCHENISSSCTWWFLFMFIQALGTADIGVPGYGDLASYPSLWDQHHGPGTTLGYHGSHPELLGFASELWTAAPHNNNGHTRAQCMIQQRYTQVSVHIPSNAVYVFRVHVSILVCITINS